MKGVSMNRRIGWFFVAAAGASAAALPLRHGVLLAQAQPQPPAQRPGPTTRPAAPTTQPATTQPANGAGAATRPANGNVRISMNFQDASIEAVLNHLSEAAGFSVITDANIPGNITIISRQPVTPAEA